MELALWTAFALIGVTLMVAPRLACTELARVARVINEQNPHVGQLLIRLLGLALFIHFGLAIATRAGLTE